MPTAHARPLAHILGAAIATAVAATALLSGCAALAGAPPLRTVTLEVVPAIAQILANAPVSAKAAVPAIAPLQAIAPLPGFHTQAVVAPYTGADIQHLVVKIYTLDTLAGTTETAIQADGGGDLVKDIPGDQLSQPVRFFNLQRDTSYRLRGFAYKAAGTADADKISLDASCSVDVAVAHDDRPTVAALPIELLDKTFSGNATSSIEFKPGPVDNAGAEDFESVAN